MHAPVALSSSRRDGATVVLIIFFALVSSPALQRNQQVLVRAPVLDARVT